MNVDLTIQESRSISKANRNKISGFIYSMYIYVSMPLFYDIRLFIGFLIIFVFFFFKLICFMRSFHTKCIYIIFIRTIKQKEVN